jgi:single-stranded DNA-binding protein
MEISGKILEIFDTQQIKETFKKRDFVIEYAENPTYPEFIKFEIIQDKCTLLDDFKPGDQVSVSFNLKGRKWTDPQGQVKYFNSLQAWKIEGEVQAGNNEVPPPPVSEKEPDWMSADDQGKEDLPF